MNEVRALIVGYGEMGRFHHQTLLARKGVQVVGVVRRSALPVEGGAPIYNSLEVALDESNPDLAILASPHALHGSQARTCLKQGCHVFVEKPLSLRLAEFESLVDLAHRSGRLLVEGLQRRYEGLCQVFRELAAADAFGEIRLIHGLFAHRFSQEDLSTGWRATPQLAGDGIIDDSAIHLIDLLVYLSGGTVNELDGCVLQGSGFRTSHSFACVFRTDRATVSACGSYLSPADSVQEEISVFATRGCLFSRRFKPQWDMAPPQLIFKSSDGEILCEYDLCQRPFGRALPLVALLDAIQFRDGLDMLHSQACKTLETHGALEMLRTSPHRSDA
jgi:predicted dehydrogenase